MSGDTIIPDQYNPQNLNRYSYVLNNPLKYADPTGHMQWEDSYKSSNGTCKQGDTSCNWVNKSKNRSTKKIKDRGDNGGQDGVGAGDTIKIPNVNIPINRGSMCNGTFVGSACFYGSTNATFISQGSSFTFSPSPSISIGSYSFSPTSFGYGNTSICPSGDTSSRYTIASSDVYSVSVSATFNWNKVKVAAQVTTNLNDGTVKGSTTLGVSGEISPKKAAFTATAGAALVAAAIIPGPVDDALVIGGGYKLCQDAGMCP